MKITRTALARAYDAIDPPAPGVRRLGPVKGFAAVAIVSAAVAGAAACSNVGETEPVSIGAATTEFVGETSTEVVETLTPVPETTNVYAEPSRADLEAILGLYITSEGIDLTQTQAEQVAWRACRALRGTTTPDSGVVDGAVYGIASQIVKEYPSLTMNQAAKVIGAGSQVYCAEFAESFGDSGR